MSARRRRLPWIDASPSPSRRPPHSRCSPALPALRSARGSSAPRLTRAWATSVRAAAAPRLPPGCTSTSPRSPPTRRHPAWHPRAPRPSTLWPRAPHPWAPCLRRRPSRPRRRGRSPPRRLAQLLVRASTMTRMRVRSRGRTSRRARSPRTTGRRVRRPHTRAAAMTTDSKVSAGRARAGRPRRRRSRRAHPAASARILTAGLSASVALGLMAAMADTPKVSTPSVASSNVSASQPLVIADRRPPTTARAQVPVTRPAPAGVSGTVSRPVPVTRPAPASPPVRATTAPPVSTSRAS